jgi:diadenosine tetraphosphatase ApaH/serine/threonine PP2A family protein phosphatase
MSFIQIYHYLRRLFLSFLFAAENRNFFEPPSTKSRMDDRSSERHRDSPPPMTSPADAVLGIYASFLSTASRIPSDLTPPLIPSAVIFPLLTFSLDILSTSPALVSVTYPVHILGDLHGSIIDLLRIFHRFGLPPTSRYLFLGDYIDRGPDSIGVICLVLALKCKWPNDIFLLRGNHEFTHVNEAYGFRADILARYNDDSLWQTVQVVFSWMPVAAVVGGSLFCVHGGISPVLESLAPLQRLELPIANYSNNSMIADLVWSDPVDGFWGFQASFRGSGKIFGHDRVEAFLTAVGLRLLVRGHGYSDHGYEPFARGMGITVFSAGDYCGLSRHKSAVLRVSGEEIDAFTIDARTGTTAPPLRWMLNDGALGISPVPLIPISRPVVQADSGFSMAVECEGEQRKYAEWESLPSSTGKRKLTFHV